MVVEDQRGALREVERVGQREGEERAGATATSAKPPSMQNAATRSPGASAAPAGALRTTPPTSLPGTNGSGGLNWYSPRVCSTSGNETPAAWTSTSTPVAAA